MVSMLSCIWNVFFFFLNAKSIRNNTKQTFAMLQKCVREVNNATDLLILSLGKNKLCSTT